MNINRFESETSEGAAYRDFYSSESITLSVSNDINEIVIREN